MPKRTHNPYNGIISIRNKLNVLINKDECGEGCLLPLPDISLADLLRGKLALSEATC